MAPGTARFIAHHLAVLSLSIHRANSYCNLLWWNDAHSPSRSPSLFAPTITKNSTNKARWRAIMRDSIAVSHCSNLSIFHSACRHMSQNNIHCDKQEQELYKHWIPIHYSLANGIIQYSHDTIQPWPLFIKLILSYNHTI